jgi:hypothetical protein
MFGFIIGPEILSKESSCDLSELVDAYVSEYPINSLGCTDLGLVA